jgi:P-type Ca2+ transporter type 2C
MWHTKDTAAVAAELNTSSLGLTSTESAERLAKYGLNELKEQPPKTPLKMLLEQFSDFMILVLLAAAVISGFVGEPVDTIAIIVIVVINAIIGFIQEYRADQAMAALKLMASPMAAVKRDGHTASVPVKELVPGDIVIIATGDIIPADLRIIELGQLKIDESALTGESVPAEKQSVPTVPEDSGVGDRINMAFKGTVVTYGRGVGIVVATGHATELGKIADMIQGEEGVMTPLQKRLAVFGRNLALIVLVICAIVFGMGMLRGGNPLTLLLTAVSLAVAAIPEAMPALITVSLALGARRLVKQNALIRRLPAVETLGSVTYICTDKTGTLTLNKMEVEEVYIDGFNVAAGDLRDERHIPPHLDEFLEALALSNDAGTSANGAIIGDPTETAIFSFAAANGAVKPELETLYPRFAEIPFDAERKMMTTFHTWRDGRIVSFTKGAAEVIIANSASALTKNGIKKFDEPSFDAVSDRMAQNGLRVLAIAMREWEQAPDNFEPASAEAKLTLLGLVGIMDPPREEAREAVANCLRAGIRPVMITGDHPLTAQAIARRLGILEEDGLVVTGAELAAMSLEEFEREVENVFVYARVAPEQKLKIVRALQDRGQFVAMTGDGVNDAPALKRADIGISMGITGTDVAKESSAMILLDDNFTTIVSAVKEGRHIFDNIRKFIKYIMTSNSGEIWTIFLAPFFGLPIPLLPIHILWINLVTDGVPALALAVEPPEKDVMARPPRHPQESIFAHGLGVDVIWVGLLLGFVCLATQAIFIKSGHWQTMVFTVLCLSQMGNVLAQRSERNSVFSIGFFANMPLLGAFVLTLVLQLMTIYVPFLNPIFRTHPLSLTELAITLGLSSIIFIAVEIKKWVVRLLDRS